MEKKLCDNCIYCYKPTGIKDYFDRTLKMPDLCKWGVDVFKHEFWLCNSPVVSEVDHTNNSLICKPCQAQNFFGNCEQFRTANAEDIIPSSIEIAPTEPLPDPIREGDEIVFESTITPATIPAVTKEETRTVEVPVTDDEGNPLYDEHNDPIMQTVEETVVVIVVPEHENDQDIKYRYQWYKNGRKLYKETSYNITVDTTEAGSSVYKCELLQDIVNNGDGGIKSAVVSSNEIEITVIAVNKILLSLKKGTDPASIKLPIIPSAIKVPYALTNGWSITNVEATEDVVLLEENVPDVTIECSDGITAYFGEGLEIMGESGTVLLKWDAE